MVILYRITYKIILQFAKVKLEEKFEKIEENISIYVCDAVWETIHKVRKIDLEILLALYRGENEEYSKKKLSRKVNSTPWYDVAKVKVAKS